MQNTEPMTHPRSSRISRRRLLQRSAGLAALGPILKMAEPLPGQSGQPRPLNKYSAPSDLRITDMRYCFVAAPYDFPIFRIDTNQGVYGLSEGFSQSVPGQAMLLKPYILGQNPLNIPAVLARIRPFMANHFFMGWGYGAIDIALHDIAGKVYGVPAWQLLGPKVRDRIRLYCDTEGVDDPKVYGRRMAERKKLGFTFFKMDLYTRLVRKRPGAVNQNGVATEKGLQYLCEFIAAVKDAVGWDAPVAADHFGSLTVNDAIRYARAFEPYQLAWAEDFIDSRDWRGHKIITDSTTTPTLTGETVFGLEEGFRDLIDNHAVDIIHPDEVASGGFREVKRTADYAAAHGIPTAIHMAGTPVGQIAAAHMAATLSRFVCCETHNVDTGWWADMVATPRPLVRDGHVEVPNAPGLGVELDEAVIREHLREPGYFEPTPFYNKRIIGYAETSPMGKRW